MSREIKFRAWNGKKMIQPESDFWNTRAIDPNGGVVDVGDGTLTINEDGLTILQFTGLLDKNGKEIYEGDIVTIEGGRGNMRVTGLIDGSFHIAHVKKDEFLLRVSFLKKGCKIIGNIYENPSLL